MGREAGTLKERKCGCCGEEFYTDSNGLKDHIEVCKRLKDLGLVPASARELLRGFPGGEG